MKTFILGLGFGINLYGQYNAFVPIMLEQYTTKALLWTDNDYDNYLLCLSTGFRCYIVIGQIGLVEECLTY